jgi:hypothetical protein
MKIKFKIVLLLFVSALIVTLSTGQLAENIDDITSTLDDSILFSNDTNSTSFNLQDQIEILNQTHASSFHFWLDSKSNELHEMNLNFSGFKLLNETYNVELREDARFAYINFTEMITNISKSISDVLFKKTLIVKDLSDVVESTYDEFQNDDEEISASIDHVYLDSKSPKTFCDINDMYMAKKESKKAGKQGAKPLSDNQKKDIKKKKRSAVNKYLEENNDFELETSNMVSIFA